MKNLQSDNKEGTFRSWHPLYDKYKLTNIVGLLNKANLWDTKQAWTFYNLLECKIKSSKFKQ